MRIPKLRKNASANQAFIETRGHRHYLGKWGEPATVERYHRVIAELLSGKPIEQTPELTVSELVALYLDHAEELYTAPDGSLTSEHDRVVAAMRPLAKFYGSLSAKEFGPSCLRAIQTAIVAHSPGEKRKQPLARRSVNQYVNIVRRVFKWGASRELVPASVWEALKSVEGLRAGRTTARETDPVTPVPPGDIDAVKPLVSRQVRALIDVQLLCGARPGELMKLRPCDIDTSAEVWTSRLTDHKTRYKGRERMLYFGPNAQQVLREFMLRPSDKFLFSPQEAEAERLATRHEKRVTPANEGNAPGTNRKRRPKVEPGEHYTVASYRRAIKRACVAAEITPWNPHRLRHNAATRFRKDYGLDAAQVLLGHAELRVTQVYSEVDHAKAIAVMKQIG